MFNASVNTPTGHHILGPYRGLELLNTSHSALLQKPNNDPWLNLEHINMSTPHRDSQLKIQDEGRLEELGYKQQLDRSWGCVHNCGACFSIIARSLPRPQGKKNADVASERHHRHHNVQTSLGLPWNPQVLTRHRLFGYGLNTGGPAIMSVGWIIVCFFSMSSVQLLIPPGPELMM